MSTKWTLIALALAMVQCETTEAISPAACTPRAFFANQTCTWTCFRQGKVYFARDVSPTPSPTALSATGGGESGESGSVVITFSDDDEVTVTETAYSEYDDNNQDDDEGRIRRQMDSDAVATEAPAPTETAPLGVNTTTTPQEAMVEYDDNRWTPSNFGVHQLNKTGSSQGSTPVWTCHNGLQFSAPVAVWYPVFYIESKSETLHVTHTVDYGVTVADTQQNSKSFGNTAQEEISHGFSHGTALSSGSSATYGTSDCHGTSSSSTTHGGFSFFGLSAGGSHTSGSSKNDCNTNSNEQSSSKTSSDAASNSDSTTNSAQSTVAQMSQAMLQNNALNSSGTAASYGGGENGAGVYWQFAWRFYANSKRSVARSLPGQLAQTPSMVQPPCCMPGLSKNAATPWLPVCLSIPNSEIASPMFCAPTVQLQASASEEEPSASTYVGLTFLIIALLVIVAVVVVAYRRNRNHDGDSDEEAPFPDGADNDDEVERSKLIPRAVDNAAYDHVYQVHGGEGRDDVGYAHA